MIEIILFSVILSIFLSIFFIVSGVTKKHKGINKKFNTKFFQDFEDWKITYHKTKYSKYNESSFDGLIIYYDQLSNEEILLAERLNLFSNFDFQLLRKRYLGLIKENHPDKYSNDQDLFKSKNEFCKKINEAYRYFKEKYFLE